MLDGGTFSVASLQPPALVRSHLVIQGDHLRHHTSSQSVFTLALRHTNVRNRVGFGHVVVQDPAGRRGG